MTIAFEAHIAISMRLMRLTSKVSTRLMSLQYGIVAESEQINTFAFVFSN